MAQTFLFSSLLLLQMITAVLRALNEGNHKAPSLMHNTYLLLLQMIMAVLHSVCTGNHRVQI